MTPNRQHFVDDLSNLNRKVSFMGEQVYNSYVNLMTICNSNDLLLANQIIEQDKLINEMEISINVEGYLLIAKQCPVASDLRRIITALKISNELERIADYTVNIAKYLKKNEETNEIFLQQITVLGTIFMEMLASILDAFKTENVKLALRVNDADEILDLEYGKSVKDLMKIAKTSTDKEIEDSMKALLVLKQIERAGDHVTNIAESIIYLVNGSRVELNQ